MLELEGNISNHHVSILTDLGVGLSYVSPRVVDLCLLTSTKSRNPWLVQLATGAKRGDNRNVDDCAIELAGQRVKTNLNVLPLGSYNVLIGMD